MHRQTILKMCEAAQMHYCDSHCRLGCNDLDYLIWDTDRLKMPGWVPAWANGVAPEDLYRWMKKSSSSNELVRAAMKQAGMRPGPRGEGERDEPGKI